jgi:hypothetical protein
VQAGADRRRTVLTYRQAVEGHQRAHDYWQAQTAKGASSGSRSGPSDAASDVLIRNRPGSQEAEHVQALAGGVSLLQPSTGSHAS